MEQRRPRLGDVVDDYCPRERRLTNHAIVAMFDDAIKQTRCTTCDTEHEYKGARVPATRRKRDATGALYEQVLAGAPDRPVARKTAADELPEAAAAVEGEPAAPPPLHATEEPGPEPVPAEETGSEDGRIRRALIRATLPRTEAQQTPRPIPEFTIRNGGRGGSYRQADPRGPRSGADGNRAGRSHQPGRSSGPSFSKSGRPQQTHAQPGGPRKSSRRGKKRSR